MSSRRVLKAAEAIREVVSMAILTDLQDPRIQNVTVTYVDVDYLVPICIEGYDWDMKLQCRYLYRDLKFNVALTSDDFTPEANKISPPMT